MQELAWLCALGGLVLGGAAALIPGFPGAAVALLGVVAFAGLTDFQVVTPEALAVATGVASLGFIGQLAAPVVSSRALGGSAGVATGAALGAAFGALIPIPGASWGAAVCGALTLGLVLSRREVLGWIRGVVGVGGGCVVGVLADTIAVLGVGAVLAVSDFIHAL